MNKPKYINVRWISEKSDKIQINTLFSDDQILSKNTYNDVGSAHETSEKKAGQPCSAEKRVEKV